MAETLNCSACARQFENHGKRRSPNRRVFCPECGTKAAWRISKRTLRAAAKSRRSDPRPGRDNAPDWMGASSQPREET